MFRFPWTNTHELNLDWLVRTVKRIEKKMSNVVTSINGSTGDVIIPIPSAFNGTPAALGNASPGSSEDYARGDHVHQMPSVSDIGASPAWHLVWTNPDPSIDVEPSTINVDLSQYTMVILESTFSTISDEGRYTQLGYVHEDNDIHYYYTITLSGPTVTNSYLWVRRFAPLHHSVIFTDCTRKPVTNVAGSVYNDHLIPLYIWAS